MILRNNNRHGYHSNHICFRHVNRKQLHRIKKKRIRKESRTGQGKGEIALTKSGIVVCFPGTGFTCKEALFERCAAKFSERGYDIVRLDFSHIPFREIDTMEEAVTIAQRTVKRQLAGVDFASFQDVVWISKSLGTLLAAKAETDYGVLPRQLYLTPLPETLRMIRPESRIIALVLGTLDRFLTGEALASFCEQRNIRCCLIDGVNHSLKDEQDPERTARIIEQIASFCG